MAFYVIFMVVCLMFFAGRIYELLNQKGLYQVELGPGGKGLTELQKEQIEKLKLPGIDFVSTSKRYYPNLDFASYTLCYN